MPIEEIRLYRDIIQKYKMDDTLSGQIDFQFQQFKERNAKYYNTK